jgi:DNA repair exonuclease SbcCD ATPase subunit
MLFSELVIQGVRNFHDMRRISLGNGLTVLVGGTGAGKSTIVDVLLHILFPDPTEPGQHSLSMIGLAIAIGWYRI